MSAAAGAPGVRATAAAAAAAAAERAAESGDENVARARVLAASKAVNNAQKRVKQGIGAGQNAFLVAKQVGLNYTTRKLENALRNAENLNVAKVATPGLVNLRVAQAQSPNSVKSDKTYKSLVDRVDAIGLLLLNKNIKPAERGRLREELVRNQNEIRIILGLNIAPRVPKRRARVSRRGGTRARRLTMRRNKI